MRNWENLTLGDLGRGFARYRPFVAVVAAVFLLTTFGAGRGNDEQQVTATGGDVAADTGDPADATAEVTPEATTDTVAVAAGPTAQPGARGGTKAAAAARPIAGAPLAPKVGAGGVLQITGEVGPDCDPATGRIKVPTKMAPPCAPPYKGDNGGAGGIGVGENTITIVRYYPKTTPAQEAALSAAGASDTRQDTEATVNQYVEYFNAHYETYGRKVEVKHVTGTADAADDAAGRADAIRVAGLKPFAVIEAANNGFVDKLAEFGIVCICSVSQPQEFYEARAPYAGYTTLMSSTQAYMHRAEFIGKRIAGKTARYAGTRDLRPMNGEQRVFGLLWYETADKAYKSGIDFFKAELRDKYGVSLKVDIDYRGFPDVAATQEAARPAIQRLKGDGVNSVIFAGDPVGPAIFTSEATRQDWYPEWIVTGSALTDTNLFARTYDQRQWDKAFGVAMLSTPYDNTQGDAYKLLVWHSGRPPQAPNTYPVIYSSPYILFTGIHMAGPRLTPQTFQQGLFNYPVTGRGMVTAPTRSYGNHGIWPFTDYTLYDDMSEVWWDPLQTGKNEVGKDGTGMYQWVDGGKRYLPGEWPKTEPKAFVREGAIHYYNQLPPSDQSPKYDPHDPGQHRKY